MRYLKLFAALLLFAVLAASTAPAAEGDPALREQAAGALRRAVEYYRGKVARHGGYVYYYSPDLTKRLGEGVATAEEIFVQPPGTPAVGLAYVRAYEATGEKLYLDAARETAAALIYGQLQSGGWTQTVEFDPASPRTGLYRNGKGRGPNNSTLDDNISQSAIRFLMHLDRATKFADADIHKSVGIALDALLKAQFPCGAFPQVWTGPVKPQPLARGNFPTYEWRTEGKIKNYWDMYTLNDGLCGTVSAVLLDAHAIYGDAKYKAALAKLGDFLIAAQMPAPQPAWAQQYNYAMQPIWARRFEPAAITGGESQDALETLLKVYRATSDAKYLEPIPPALAYLKQSRLPDGRLARYYELQTNKPLYMTRRGDEYSLTYSDADLPDHYGWKVASRLEAIEADYAAANAGRTLTAPATASDLADQVKKIIAELDGDNRWVSTYAGEPLYGQPKFKPGEKYLHSGVFSKNVELLSAYLKTTR